MTVAGFKVAAGILPKESQQGLDKPQTPWNYHLQNKQLKNNASVT